MTRLHFTSESIDRAWREMMAEIEAQDADDQPDDDLLIFQEYEEGLLA